MADRGASGISSTACLLPLIIVLRCVTLRFVRSLSHTDTEKWGLIGEQILSERRKPSGSVEHERERVDRSEGRMKERPEESAKVTVKANARDDMEEEAAAMSLCSAKRKRGRDETSNKGEERQAKKMHLHAVMHESSCREMSRVDSGQQGVEQEKDKRSERNKRERDAEEGVFVESPKEHGAAHEAISSHEDNLVPSGEWLSSVQVVWSCVLVFPCFAACDSPSRATRVPCFRIALCNCVCRSSRHIILYSDTFICIRRAYTVSSTPSKLRYYIRARTIGAVFAAGHARLA